MGNTRHIRSKFPYGDIFNYIVAKIELDPKEGIAIEKPKEKDRMFEQEYVEYMKLLSADRRR